MLNLAEQNTIKHFVEAFTVSTLNSDDPVYEAYIDLSFIQDTLIKRMESHYVIHGTHFGVNFNYGDPDYKRKSMLFREIGQVVISQSTAYDLSNLNHSIGLGSIFFRDNSTLDTATSQFLEIKPKSINANYGFFCFSDPFQNQAIQLISNSTCLLFVSNGPKDFYTTSKFQNQLNSKSFFSCMKVLSTYGFSVEKCFFHQKSIFFVAPNDVITIVYHKNCVIRLMKNQSPSRKSILNKLYELAIENFDSESLLEYKTASLQLGGFDFFNRFCNKFISTKEPLLHCNTEVKKQLIKYYYNIATELGFFRNFHPQSESSKQILNTVVFVLLFS